MPFVILVLLALAAGVVGFTLARRFPVAGPDAAAAGSTAVGTELAEQAEHRPWLRRMLAHRLDPDTLTGLALTATAAIAVGGGLALGILAFLVRSSGELVSLDRSVGRWGQDHATPLSTSLIHAVTDLAGTPAVVAVVVTVSVVETVRRRNRLIAPFLLTVVVGETVIVHAVKHGLHRVRPTFSPVAETLGPSFPSGHSATAAALYAGVALVVARGRTPLVRALLFGTSTAVAVAVACSRVLLGVHWMSDTIAGVAVGWGWFAVCAIAFGGGLLDFGAPAKRAAAGARDGTGDADRREARPRAGGGAARSRS